MSFFKSSLPHRAWTCWGLLMCGALLVVLGTTQTISSSDCQCASSDLLCALPENYCYCSSSQLVTVEALNNRSYFWRFDPEDYTIHLSKFDPANLTDPSYYFLYCNKFGSISFQPYALVNQRKNSNNNPNNKDDTKDVNYWLCYDNWDLVVNENYYNSTEIQTQDFAKVSNFDWQKQKWIRSTSSFKLLYYSLYIISKDGELAFEHDDSSDEFKEAASFFVYTENAAVLEGPSPPPALSPIEIFAIVLGTVIAVSILIAGTVTFGGVLIKKGRELKERRRRLYIASLDEAD